MTCLIYRTFILRIWPLNMTSYTSFVNGKSQATAVNGQLLQKRRSASKGLGSADCVDSDNIWGSFVTVFGGSSEFFAFFDWANRSPNLVFGLALEIFVVAMPKHDSLKLPLLQKSQTSGLHMSEKYDNPLGIILLLRSTGVRSREVWSVSTFTLSFFRIPKCGPPLVGCGGLQSHFQKGKRSRLGSRGVEVEDRYNEVEAEKA